MPVELDAPPIRRAVAVCAHEADVAPPRAGLFVIVSISCPEDEDPEPSRSTALTPSISTWAGGYASAGSCWA